LACFKDCPVPVNFRRGVWLLRNNAANASLKLMGSMVIGDGLVAMKPL